MLNKEYPLHDMNTVFELMSSTIEAGGTDEKARDELLFLNHLFAALPANHSQTTGIGAMGITHNYHGLTGSA